MNFRNNKTISPIFGLSVTSNLRNYLEDVQNGTNKALIQSIRKAYKAKNLDDMKIEMEKLPCIGNVFNQNVSYLDWNNLQIIQIEILDIKKSPANSLYLDRHTMIEHRNVLDNGNIVWFYYKAPKNCHREAIDTLVQYLKEGYEIHNINLGKIKNYEYKLEVGYDPSIYLNENAECFNYKYWKKKFESKKIKAALTKERY